MDTLSIVLLSLLALLIVYAAVLGIMMFRVGILRRGDKDINYDGVSDPALVRPSGHSPYRQRSVAGNIWWNSQQLERLELTSRDGLRLVGHILYAEQPTDRLAFVVHGHRSCSGEMGFIAKIYAERGWNVFMADQRAHGKSEGRYFGMGWLEKNDMLDWLRLLNEKLGDNTRVLLHGISMGAATVMMMCGESGLPKNVRCAIEDCGYTTARGSFIYHMMVDKSMRLLPFKNLVVSAGSVCAKIKAGYWFAQADSRPALKRSTTPMLFIHGTHDLVVPFDMMRELYDSCGSDKKMLIVENADHGVSYFIDTPAYENAVDGFIEKHVD